MGTRADFYVGRGENAEWLGSIAWDGYDVPDPVIRATTEEAFRSAVSELLADRDDGTLPEHGWPWPWETSSTTDYAYAFDDGATHTSNYGGPWYDAATPPERDDDGEMVEAGDAAVFPNMKDRQNVTFGARSGVIIVGG